MIIKSNPDGYTVWGNIQGFPVILTDAPYERLKSNPEFAIEFLDIVYSEMEKVHKEMKPLEISLRKAIEMQEHYLVTNGDLQDENKRLREALAFYAKGDNWWTYDIPGGYASAASVDKGRKAREAMKGGENK